MVLLYRDPLFREHNPRSTHPESPWRLDAIEQHLTSAGLAARCTPGTWSPLPREQLAAAHEPDVLALVEEAVAAGGGMLDPDTPVSRRSLDVALAAAGVAVAAVDAVVAGPDRRALCLVRPPGHHATPSRSMGFCLFNNVALAARHARAAHGVGRVLIVDWDVHHGNGTQDVFYADDSVAFVSIHRYGGGFYPGTGAADETGTGPGLGTTTNVPLPRGTPPAEYHDAFRRAVETAAARHRPELVIVSAGFDAHRLDPIGGLGLDADDYRPLTKLVLDVADTHAGGKLVSCLEGGYHLDALAASVGAHLEELLAVRPPG
jgi:acetoin utilization deacetylase AcuC-like enzyme